MVSLEEMNALKFREIFSHVGFLRESTGINDIHVWNKVKEAFLEKEEEGFRIKLVLSISDKYIVEEKINDDFLFLLSQSGEVNYIPLIGIYENEIVDNQISLSLLLKKDIYKDKNKFIFMHFKEYNVKVMSDETNEKVSLNGIDYLGSRLKERKKKPQYYFTPKGFSE